MTVDIIITKLDEVWMKVQCKEHFMELDIADRFSFLVKNAEHDPRYIRNKWDGMKRLYDRRSHRMYSGLLVQLLEFCEKQGFTYHIDPDLVNVNDDVLEDEDIDHLIELFNPHDDGNPITPYDYQRFAFKHAMNMNRSLLLAATSAGKSLIIYLMVRAYQLMEEMQGKTIFIVVPSISLVEQMYSDFENYSNFKGNTWYASRHVQKVSSKYCKHVNSQIVITTWQSMEKLPYWLYEDIGTIIVDEAHGAQANVLSNILEQCKNTKFRHGLTGTLDDFECHELVIQGLTGQKQTVVTAKELIDSGRASKVKVLVTILEYPEHVRKELHNLKSKKKKGVEKHEVETQFLMACKERNGFLLNMIRSVEQNTIVLFDRVEDYGKVLYEQYKETHENTFYIAGEVDSTEREKIRTSMEQYNDARIFASSGTMKQGVSIKKLFYMFLISSGKAKIKLLQSLGRLMRLHKDKECSYLIDIVDDLSYNGYPNFSYKHAAERLAYYEKEGHEVVFERYKVPYPSINSPLR